jgi:hypothetical protein
MEQVRERAASAIAHAPIHRIHPTATQHRVLTLGRRTGADTGEHFAAEHAGEAV